MKVGILTFHRAHNYGAVLQCYALNKAIETMGYECETVDYRPDYFRKRYYLRSSMKQNKVSIRMLIKRILTKPILSKRNRKFENFINNYLPLSRNFFCEGKDMTSDYMQYDLYITGSDQVFSPTCAEFDSVFFLDFPAANGKKKFSYAASFGSDKIPVELKGEYERRLKTFEAISVREETGVSIINNFMKKNITISCDPTLLLSKEEWNIPVYDWKEHGDYVLLYYVEATPLLRKNANELAQKHNCKLICVTSNMNCRDILGVENAKYGIKTINSCSPEEFLMLIKNAVSVVTSSFHGAVFSIIFEKEFYVDIDLGKGKKNTRVVNLLDKLGLENRIIVNDIMEIDNKIDWTNVELKRNEMKQEGLNYLHSILHT